MKLVDLIDGRTYVVQEGEFPLAPVARGYAFGVRAGERFFQWHHGDVFGSGARVLRYMALPDAAGRMYLVLEKVC